MRFIAKQMLFMYFAGMLGLFTSCNSDDPNEKQKNQDAPTHLTINLNLSKLSETSSLSLRADSDSYATEKEVKIETANVFIYNPSGFCDSYIAVPGSSFELRGGVYASSDKIPANTGNKKIFVAVNLPPTVVDVLKNGMSNELTQNACTLTQNELVSANSLAMTGSLIEYEIKDESHASENVINVQMKRLTAKVTVEKSQSLVIGGVAGKTGNLSFAVVNFNNRSFLIQRSDTHDPNWAADDFNANDFTPVFDETNDDAYSFVLFNEANISKITDYNALYAAENTSQLHRKKEITRLLIRGTFIPDWIIVKEGNNFASRHSSSLGVYNPVDFWVITTSAPEKELRFFFTYSVAADYAAANNIPINDDNIIKYTNGKCYWDIFLNKNNQWNVLRNEYYKCTVNRIMSPGRPLPPVPDPDEPPSSESILDATIDVVPWSAIADDFELTP